MREDFDKKLQSDFPFMKRDMSDKPIKDRIKTHNCYQIFGTECNDGWYQMIHDLCEKISSRYAEEGIPANEIDLEVLQIKEKFGTLRFYYSFKGVSCGLQAIDFLGGTSLRFEPQNDEDDVAKKKLRHDIAELVRGQERWSAHICEYCGKKGTLRMDMPWKKNLCDDCLILHLTKSKK